MNHLTPSRGGCALAALLAAVLFLGTACGGGTSASGDRTGEDTLPVVLELQTPLGLQGTRGVGPNVGIVFHLRDSEFDPADIEVQYGVDRDRSGTIEEEEFLPATPGSGGDGTAALNASPGGGAMHIFVWDSLADITTGRWMTQDFEYDPLTGRALRDNFGEPIFRFFPGTLVRIRPVAGGVVGAWRYSDPFDVNNNNRPSVSVGAVDIPPEGVNDQPQTVNEKVVVNWTAVDPDEDPLYIAVDWVSVPEGFDPTAHTTEELAELPWSQATGHRLGVADQNDPSPASPTGIAHKYEWNSVADAGTVNGWMLLRARPIDGKLEVGDWYYSTAPFLLDNYTVFTDPISTAEGTERLNPVANARATLLRGTALETILVTGGSAAEGGDGTDYAALFYPGSSQTTKGAISAIAGGMQEARVGHTATRLLDGRVLIVGGAGAGGAVSDTAEIYDPTTRKFTLVTDKMSTARRDHVAVLLKSGNVLIAGGRNESGTLLTSAEIFVVSPVGSTQPEFDSLDVALYMKQARAGAEAALLPDGRVLVAGGRGNAGPLATVEIYDPTLSPQLGGFENADVNEDMGRAREGLTLTSTVDATYAAVAAGGMASPPTDTLERFDWTTDRWSDSSVTMRSPRAYHGAVRLGDGQILFAGGQIDEGGTLTATADLYDPSADTMDLPNGEMNVAVRNAATAIMTKGRPVFFGGLTSSAASDAVQVFTPDGAFNEPPLAQVADMLGSLEPWSFGIRILWRAIDPEGDPVRIACQFRIKPSPDDDSTKLPDQILDRWLPATMAKQTVLGEQSSGQTALSSRKDFVDTVDDPIDAPDVDPGEHRFVWATFEDFPRGDYDNVFFRIFLYGAEEGTGVESARFSISKNAPVIARIEDPLNKSGNLVVPFFLQDADQGELARLDWSYGIDVNGDGKIVEADGEEFLPLTHSEVTSVVNGTGYDDAGTDDVVTGSKDPDPNNDYTTPGGIPWGKKHYLVWDSVYDLGAPLNPRSDISLRLTPYDYPPGQPGDASLGIEQTLAGFTLERDPNALSLERWYPMYAGGDPAGTHDFAGVKLDEPIVFEFTAPVEPSSLSEDTLRIYRTSTGKTVSGFYEVVNTATSGKVTFHPQVQDLSNRDDVLVGNGAYSLYLPGYDPANRGNPVLQQSGVDPKDTNARNLLIGSVTANAFKTETDTSAANRYGYLPDSTKPSYDSRVTPSGSSEVATNSVISFEFDDYLMPSSVNATGFKVVAKAYTGVESVVYGTLSLQNIVDDSGPGGTVRRYSILTLTPDAPLPAGTVEIRANLGTTLKDLVGNGLSTAVVSTFTTSSTATTVGSSVNEEFDDKNHRSDSETTAFWGQYDPVNLGGAAGTGVKGELTGLYDFGDGSDQTLDFSKGDVTIDTDVQDVWNLTSLTVPFGKKLIVKGSKPLIMRVLGDVTVLGTIDAAGKDGEGGVWYDCWNTTSGYGAAGGRGGPGGGDGGGGGYYKWQQTYAPTPSSGKVGYGATSGSRGTHGDAAEYNPNNSNPNGYYAPGGGGAGHANAGEDGGDGYYYYTSTYSKGVGGSKFGYSDLRNGLEAGSGGGAGGGFTLYYPSTSGSTKYYRYGHASGGGGGGGGGAVKITASGKISVTGAGEILANGGDGGDTSRYGLYSYVWYQYTSTSGSNKYKYWSTYSSYPGAGGAGAGGSVYLQAGAGFDLHGKVDVSGGKGGFGYYYKYYAYSYAYYDHKGGDGGDGRIVLDGPNEISISDAADLRGCLTVGTSKTISGGSGKTDWTVSGTVTVNTDYGSGAPSGTFDSKTGRFYVNDFTVKSGSTLRITGSQPFKLYATGDVDIAGTVDGKGSDGPDFNQSGYYSSSSGFRPYERVYGGSGVGGGGAGGENCESIQYVTPPLSGTDGYGPSTDSTRGGKGAGNHGSPGTKAFAYGNEYYYTTYTRKYAYRYWYYGGGGGGGGSAEPGETAPMKVAWSGQKRQGVPGKGGSAVFSDATVDESTITGGGGGGGGCNGGYKYGYDYYNTQGTITYSYKYYYGYGTGTGGGGGGAGFLVVADGKVTVSGKIDVQGGRGGDNRAYSYSYVSYGAGAGGGGGGGNVCMKAAGGFDLDGGLIDARGGPGGWCYYEYTSSTSYDYGTNIYSYGGDGGRGAITLIAGAGKEPDIVNVGNAFLGDNGTVETGKFSQTKDGISTWYDTGATAPMFTSVVLSGTAIANAYVAGAQTDPDTGLADPTTSTGWKAITELSDLKGCRWVRFWVELKGTTTSTAPSVDTVTISYTYKK